MRRASLCVILAVVLLIPAFAQQSQPSFDGKSWWDHIKVLAADDMEGRDTGSRGLKKAEAYAVRQLKAADLQPAGVKGYYQPVKFESRQLVENESSAALVRDGKAEPLALGEDAIFSTRVDLAPRVDAPLVFVGYGLSIPEKDFDDLAGLDGARRLTAQRQATSKLLDHLPGDVDPAVFRYLCQVRGRDFVLSGSHLDLPL